MTDPTVTVPFKLPDLIGGLAEGKGLAKASPQELALEFVVKETVFDVFKSGIKEVRIPRSEIEAVQLQQGLFRDKLRVRVKSIACIQDLPNSETGEVVLHIARRNRAQAGDVVSVLGGRT
ncbi:MAG TPA: hypothetical protein VLT36_20345 [Candidatus Dormibacteraeota bacterium]|nr:hypothetical protein [Candidatus Dormibacteraeota bacterium]